MMGDGTETVRHFFDTEEALAWLDKPGFFVSSLKK
jgi:hypothetical protein